MASAVWCVASCWALLSACGRIGFEPGATGGSGAGDARSAADIPGLVVVYPMDGEINNGIVPALAAADSGSCAMAACPTPVTGRIGGGYEFNASCVISVPPGVAAHVGDQPYTVALWLAPLASTNNLALFGKPFSPSQSSNVAALAIPAATRHLTFETTPDGNPFEYLDTPLDIDVADGAWHHAAVVWNGSVKRIYLDGNLVGTSSPTTVATSSQPLVIGADLDDSVAVHHYTGALDDFRIYARALDDDEVGVLSAGTPTSAGGTRSAARASGRY